MRLNPAGTTRRNGILKPSWARYSAALASGLAVLAAAGCASSSAAGGVVSSKITVAVVDGINNAPVFLADQDGLFAAAGLKDVVINSYSQDSAVFGALQKNQADIAATDYGTLFYEQSLAGTKPKGQSQPLPSYKILADGYDAAAGSLEVLSVANSGVTTPAQLPGATVAMPNDDILPGIQLNSGIPNSLETAAATSALGDFVADNNSVNWVEMPEAQEVPELLAGKVQAILVGQPYIVEAELKGAFEVMDAASGATANLPLSGYVTTSAWAKANPTVVADFEAAMAKAQSEASMAGPFQDMLHAKAGMTQQVADLATVGTYPTSTSEAQLASVSRLLWESGMIDTPEPLAIPLATDP